MDFGDIGFHRILEVREILEQVSDWQLLKERPAGFIKKTPWPESASEQYRPSDRRLSAK
jgi:hypothetical protein